SRGTPMRLGALLGPIDPTNPDALAEQAKQLEAEGYDSLWSAQAVGRGNFMTDPFIALATAAAVTNRVELGTAILQLPLYHPTDIASKAYSLMQPSANRLLLGLGAGSTQADHDVHGKDFAARFRQFNESLTELKQIFAGGEPSEQLSAWQQVAAGPPLLYGTWGKGVARAANEFDGWIASGMNKTPDDLAKALPAYREAGGTRAMVSTILLTADHTLADIKNLLGRYNEIGFDDAIVMFLPGAPASAAVRDLSN
ncbi:MAG: LLM class flavin-dependent oxidoreductase, partial [Pseudomonadales bacterium]